MPTREANSASSAQSQALGPNPRAAAEWLRRVEAEYASSAIAANYSVWLLKLGASPDLVRDSFRIAEDELTHAELSHAAHLAAGGTGTPAMVEESLGLVPVAETLEDDAVRVALSFFCLGETVAVPLFRTMREHCTEPACRAALDRILRDEVFHRDFGWTALHWFLEGPRGDRHRENLQAALPTLWGTLEDSYRRSPQPFQEDDRSWGLIPGAEYGAILDRALEKDYRPRFAALGLSI